MASYLIVGPSWIGDMVMAQSLFMSIQQRDPTAVIDVVAPSWSVPVLARMPEVRDAIPLDVKHGEWGFFIRRALGVSLRDKCYDEAIIIPRSWKSALIPFFAKIKKRVGFLGELRFGLLTERRKLDKKILNQTVKRFVSLGLPSRQAYPPAQIPNPNMRVNERNQQVLFNRFSLSTDKPAIALMPGAEYGPAKQWPLPHFREVAEHMLGIGYQVWVLGSAGDREDGEEVCRELVGEAYNLCGETDLADAIDLIAAARLVVCNDSGLMHVAAAVGTHIHAIYGSTSVNFTPPLTRQATVHALNLSCAPCFQRQCKFGHYNCLKELHAKDVVKRISTENTDYEL